MSFAYSPQYQYIMYYNAKSGCSTWRQLFLYLHKNEVKKISNGHHRIRKDFPKPNNIPRNIRNIMVVRNPFSRVVSMYTNRYNNPKSGNRLIYRKLKNTNLVNTNESISFRKFVNILFELDNMNKINSFNEHVYKQTRLLQNNTRIVKLENFNTDIKQAYIDIGLEELVHNIQIFLDKNNTHVNTTIKTNETEFVGDKIYKINNDKFPNYKYFYDEDIKNKVIKIYKDDFIKFNYDTNLL